MADSGRVTGSREPSPGSTGLGPSGFDPARWRCGHLRSADNTYTDNGGRGGRERHGCLTCRRAARNARERAARALTSKNAIIASQQQTIDFLVRQLAIAMEARQGRDGETRLDPKDDSAGRRHRPTPQTKDGPNHD